MSTAPESPAPDAADPDGADPDGADPDAVVPPGPVPDADALDAGDIARLTQGSTRRAPRYGRFVGVGVLVGVVLAAGVALLGPTGPTLGREAIFLLLALALGSAGALLGALGAVLAERRPR